MNTTPPSLSFIAILDFSARWKYLTESVSDLLGWEPSDLREHSFFELVHPEELSQVQRLHCETISSDKAATMAYMRLRHKDVHKGYLLCAVVRPIFVSSRLTLMFPCSLGLYLSYYSLRRLQASRTVVHDRVVGRPGGEALHTSSTAQEITVISPAASNFEFRRWHESSPTTAPPTPLYPPVDLPAMQSSRTALILDRFSTNCTVTHYSNSQLIPSGAATKRPFFDFVARQDEALVRSWLVAIKTCGVNERGYPSSGGFGYGRFLLFTEGRDSKALEPPPVASTWRSGRVSSPPVENTVSVDAIFSAHSDGLVCILRRAQ
ncbi:DNA repair protein rhp42 [Mycena sanguinolenta]|uniref:DNA repair protein rhp42 n=1 Tax=Mycena sanguinolenta TaxID=230812 RepID=A0A8H6XXJ7_9AGAR|nr:DNA repair protein rhp42 [Mycena sanguinolenta]